MTHAETRRASPRTIAWLVGLVALTLAAAYGLKLILRAPHLVGAAIPLADGNLLLFVGDVDKQPEWTVYGRDGAARERWADRSLPGGIVHSPDGRLRDPVAEAVDVRRLVANMTLVGPGQTKLFRDVVGDRVVTFQAPPGVLLQRLSYDSSQEERLDRARPDGSPVWSVSVPELFGPSKFRFDVMEVCHAHLRDPRTLLLVIQARSSSSHRPVVHAVARIVEVEASTGRVTSRADVAPP